MLVVVPAEKRLEPTTRVKQSGEEARVVGLVFERLELRFAKSVVVGDVRADLGTSLNDVRVNLD